jgi:hypothetical protein
MASSHSQSHFHQSKQEAFNPVKVYAWFAAIPSLCKSIWLMAVAQHQFYLDKKQQHKENGGAGGTAIALHSTLSTNGGVHMTATTSNGLHSTSNALLKINMSTSSITTNVSNGHATSLMGKNDDATNSTSQQQNLWQFRSLSELATELNESTTTTELASWPDKFAAASARKSNLIASLLPSERKRN